MKNRFLLLAFCAFACGIIACEKAENIDYFEGGSAPVLTASTTSVALEPGTEANTAIVLKWTNPNYKFTTGISSQDVTYTIEMDTLGANFSSSKKVSTVVSKDLVKSYTVSELNAILGNDMLLQLNPRRNYTIQVRVTSSIGTQVQLPSNVISFITKPFAPPPKVEPPTNETLWVTGDAFSSGWSNPLGAPYEGSQKFTKVSNTLYEITVPMVGNGGYKLIQINGDWDTQYHMVTGAWDGGTFEKKNSDPQFPGPPAAGNYKISVDFQLGKYTVVKQ